jgi:phage terminase large subunit-like protein
MDVHDLDIQRLVRTGKLQELFQSLDEGDRIRFSKEAEMLLGMYSTFYLTKNILGYTKLGNFHRQMCNHFDDWFYYNVLVLAPRQHYKTTCLNIGGNIRHGLIDPDIQICILMHSLDKAKEVLGELRSHYISNEKFRDLYPDHAVRVYKEEGSMFKFTTPARKKMFLRQPTFTAASIMKKLVSSHYNLFVYDDIVDDENSATLELREKVKDHYGLTSPMIIDRSKDGVKWMRMYGTHWHYEDLYKEILYEDRETNYWKKMVRAAEWNEADPESGQKKHFILFPEQWNQKLLDDERKKLGDYRYSCLYLNEPVPAEDRVMKPENLRYYDPNIRIMTPLNKCITVDPAASAETGKGDPTVISAFAMDHQSNIYVLDISKKFLKVNEIVEEILHFHILHNIRDIGIESVSLSKWLLQLLEQRIEEELLNINLIPMKRDAYRSGVSRIQKKGEGGRQERVAGFLNQGQILLRKDEPLKEYIIMEISQWPHTRHDHFMDTITDAIEILKPPFLMKNNSDQYRKPILKIGARGNFQTGYNTRA